MFYFFKFDFHNIFRRFYSIVLIIIPLWIIPLWTLWIIPLWTLWIIPLSKRNPLSKSISCISIRTSGASIETYYLIATRHTLHVVIICIGIINIIWSETTLIDT